MTRSIKAVIFDMGGVLVRCMRPDVRAELGKPYGLTRERLEAVVFGSAMAALASVGKASDAELWEHIRGTVGVAPAELAAFQEKFWSADNVDDELVKVIKALRKTYKTGLLSNAWLDARDALTMKYPHLMNSFDVSIFSAEVGLVKPDPAMYNLILEKLGVAAQEAVFVDDFIENIVGAEQLGLHAIRFVSAEQAMADLRKVVTW